MQKYESRFSAFEISYVSFHSKYINMLARTSDWIFNPMLYTGIIVV